MKKYDKYNLQAVSGEKVKSRILRFVPVFLLLIQAACTDSEQIEKELLVNIPVTDSVVFAAIGDYGMAGEGERKVSELVKSWDPEFIITTGDNNYPFGDYNTLKSNITDYYGDFIYNYDAPEEYRCNGKAFLDSVNRFFPSPGNHDYGNAEGLKPYLSYFTLPGNESYYTFSRGNVRLFSINSNAVNLDEQKLWLEQTISGSSEIFNVVYFHHSPFSPGPHGNYGLMQWDFYGMGFDAVLSGHGHFYGRIQKKGQEELYYLINGAGGRNLYECDTTAMDPEIFNSFCFDDNYGAIKATAGDKELIFEFWSVDLPLSPVDRIVIAKNQ